MTLETTSPDLQKVDDKLKYWSQQLHDLSGRNRLLFYRDTKSSTATIEHPEFLKLFEILVEKGSELVVPLPAPDEAEEAVPVPEELIAEELGLEDVMQGQVEPIEGNLADPAADEGPDAAELERAVLDPALLEQDSPKPKKPRKLKDNEIFSNHPVPVLNRVMYNLRYVGRTIQEEQGFNILYMTFGMLSWNSGKFGEAGHAPLILVPISVERESALAGYKIKMAEEDIVVNPVLQTKLAKDFGFQFPEVGNDLSAAELEQFLAKAGELIRRHAGWEIEAKATVGAFNFMTQVLIKDFENYAALYRVHPFVQALSGVESARIPQPDSVPQARQLDDVVDPATVFQILDADSSQQEAIEAAKLGLSFVLQGPPGTGKSQTIANIIVESMMAGKKILFVSQKMAALEVVQNRLSRNGLREFCLEVHSHKMDKRKVVRELMASLTNTPLLINRADWRLRRQELKQVRDELNTYVRQLHQPQFELGLSLYQAQGGLAHSLDAPQLNFPVPNLEKLSPADFSRRLALVREISNYGIIIETYSQNRWKGYKGTESTLESREKLAESFQDTLDAIEALHRELCEIAGHYHLPLPETVQDCLDYSEALARFQPEIFSFELQKTIEHYLEQNRSLFRFFSRPYRQAAAKLKALRRSGPAADEREFNRALQVVQRIGRGRNPLLSEAAPGAGQIALDADALEKYRRQVLAGFELALSLFDPNDLPPALRKKYAQSPAEAADWFADCGTYVEELADWANFNAVRRQCNENGLGDFVNQALRIQLPPAQWDGAFARRFYSLLSEKLSADHPLLQKFRGSVQADLISRFRTLDLAAIEDSSHEIRAKLFAQKPQLTGIQSGSGETSILRREYNKKRRLKPLRKLFVEIPNLIQALKPCLMMSPLTVCQLLDPAIYKFDIVVFDEASQIPPEYAMGGLLRAQQVIVAGDSQQLPPTNFFHNLETGRYADEAEAEEATFESILSACDSCGFPNKLLNWHYRSRDESLIAYSNHHFYDNRLYTFPNSSLNNPETGLKFVYVKDGVYKGGENARYNIREARRVAELVFEHLTTSPALSLGIVAFSVQQRRMIEVEIEKMRIENPALDAWFSYEADEPIFIKNLENVQGDERDVIIISVGYGKDADGKMTLNFGPINREGGARRLNVAVTRARYLVKLVASIQPEDIDLTRATSRGAALLRNYLETAREGVQAVYQNARRSAENEFGSLFEESVYNELTARGVQLARQVGVSEYRIDLAVLDPQDPTRFLLGIECDGPMYRSAPTARDRDRLRQQVLEGLGWKIRRIWSRDWVQNREKEIEKILTAVEARRKELAAAQVAVP